MGDDGGAKEELVVMGVQDALQPGGRAPAQLRKSQGGKGGAGWGSGEERSRGRGRAGEAKEPIHPCHPLIQVY